MADFAVITEYSVGLLANELVRIVRKCSGSIEVHEVAGVGKTKGVIVPSYLLTQVEVGEIRGPNIAEKEMVFLSKNVAENIPVGSIVKVDSVHMIWNWDGTTTVKVGIVEPLTRNYAIVDREDLTRPSDIKEEDVKVPLKHMNIVTDERGELMVIITADILRSIQ